CPGSTSRRPPGRSTARVARAATRRRVRVRETLPGMAGEKRVEPRLLFEEHEVERDADAGGIEPRPAPPAATPFRAYPDVARDRPVRTEFTYGIPGELAAGVAPGVRV